MGIEWNTAKFLLGCRGSGVEFGRVLTLGRPWLYIDSKSIRSLFIDYYGSLPPDFDLALADNQYAEGFFSLLGAQEVVTLDASDFEGASLIHDLNEPIPLSQRGQYDLVYDPGTLEHVFNFPVALRSAMEAVKIGGHLLLHTPTNNHCGHGFYQFSPELFYRALSKENGFIIKRMIAFGVFPRSQWYEVADPAQAKCRVEIAHDPHRVLLLVLAQRTHETQIFETMPQQSDYAAAWNADDSSNARNRYFVARLRDAWSAGRLPYALVRWLITLARTPSLKEAWDNRGRSMKLQPKLFQAIDR